MLLALKKSTCLSRSHRLLQQSTCIGVKTMNIKYIWYINNISQYIPIYKHDKKPLLLPICWRRFTLLCVVNRLLYAIIHPAWLSRLISSAFRNGGSKKGLKFLCYAKKGWKCAWALLWFAFYFCNDLYSIALFFFFAVQIAK